MSTEVINTDSKPRTSKPSCSGSTLSQPRGTFKAGGNYRPKANAVFGDPKSSIAQRDVESDKNQQTPPSGKRSALPGNFVSVQTQRKPFTFYLYLVKQMFHNENYEEIVLLGKDHEDVFQAVKIVEVLITHKYAVVSKIKTHTTFSRGKCIPKLVITLKKTPEFEQVYLDFEHKKAERLAHKYGVKYQVKNTTGDSDKGKREETD